MRLDDPERPRGVDGKRLQVSGSPLPAVTLICVEKAVGEQAQPGWLACIHAHVSGVSFRYYTGIIENLAEFERAWLDSPEDALARYFGYLGPEARPVPLVPLNSLGEVGDLWEAEGEAGG